MNIKLLFPFFQSIGRSRTQQGGPVVPADYLCARLSSPGGREENQDACEALQLSNGIRLYMVADGLGGHGGGAVASRVAIDSIVENAAEYVLFKTEALNEQIPFTTDTLNDLKDGAQQAITQRQKEDSALERMRTTLVLLAINDEQAQWLHCGDARLYHFRDNKVKFQTRDHSVPQMLVSSGDMDASEIRSHPDRNRVLRALGGDANEARAAVSKSPEPLLAGDAFLLCTDGFWEYVLEKEMEATLAQAKTPVRWLKGMEQILQRRVQTENKDDNDNYTALAVMAIKSAARDRSADCIEIPQLPLKQPGEQKRDSLPDNQHDEIHPETPEKQNRCDTPGINVAVATTNTHPGFQIANSIQKS